MKYKKIFSLVLATSFILASCSVSESPNGANENADSKQVIEVKNTDDANKVADETKDQQASTNSLYPEVSLSINDAKKAFDLEFGVGDIGITSISLDNDNGNYYYEIDGFLDNKEYEAKIDANTGDILESKSEAENENKEVLDFTLLKDPNDVITKALEGKENAYVKEWELSIENGKAVYELDIENADDMEIDAYEKTN